MKNSIFAEEGFSLVSAMILISVLSIVSIGASQLFDQQIDVLKIVRMQQRLGLLEKKLTNTARSSAAMRESALRNPNSILSLCILSNECKALSTFEKIELYDANKQKISGLYDLNGEACTKNCPIEAVTAIRLRCGGGVSSCTLPSEVQTLFTIRKASAEQLKGRVFNPITKTISLSRFSCPKGEYVRSITGDGQLICDASFASSNGAVCPAKTAAIGIDAAGFVKCRQIVDYCKTPLGLATVLDTSASMSANSGIDLAKLGLSKFVERLKIKDQGSFTSFNAQAAVRQNLTNNISALAAAILRERASSNTDMVAGLTKAAGTLSAYAEGAKVMIFVSDGFHNGVGDPVAAAAALKAQGIRVLTVGFSRSADTRMLQEIASSPQDFFDATEIGNLNRVLDTLGDLTCR